MRLRFVDRLLSLSPALSIEGEKCVSFEEAMLLRPSLARGVPGTLLVEWLGQLTAVLVAESTQYTSLAVLGSFARCTIGEALHAGDKARLTIRARSWHEDSAYVDGVALTPEGAEAMRIERAVFAFVPLAPLWDEEELRAAVRAARGEFPGPVGLR